MKHATSHRGCEYASARNPVSSAARSGIAATLAPGAPQHGVDQAAGAAPRRLARERHGSVDRGVRRHAAQMAHLEKPEPERPEHGRLELFERLRAQLRQFIIQPAAPGERAEHQPRQQAAIGRGKRGQAMAEHHVGEGRVAMHADEDFERGAADLQARRAARAAHPAPSRRVRAWRIGGRRVIPGARPG